MFREPEAYSAFLLDAFPRLEEAIEAEITPDSYFSEDPFDEFERMVKIRVEQTLRYFTQLEVKGGGSRGDAMMRDFRSLIEGLYASLPKNRPYTMLQTLQAIPVYMLDMLEKRYGIDITSTAFYTQCMERFDEETAEDIGAVIMAAGLFDKSAKSEKFHQQTLPRCNQSTQRDSGDRARTRYKQPGDHAK